MTVDDVVALVQGRGEMLMVDVAIHFLVDVEEARALVEPLIASGQVERVWRPMTSELRTLCDCEREEVLLFKVMEGDGQRESDTGSIEGEVVGE